MPKLQTTVQIDTGKCQLYALGALINLYFALTD
eukprot:COSAG01_NODE_7767_length_3066_cov_2.383552_2_plen_33_part_00